MTILPATEWKPGAEGVFEDLPEKVYRQAPGVNVSSLKAMRYSPAHYKAALEDTETERTGALITGTLVHAMTLEAKPKPYVVRPPQFDSWRSKAAQEWRDSQTLDVLTPEEEKTVLRCVEALKRDDYLCAMASAGIAELSVFKRHPRTGLLMKGRADLVSYDEDGQLHGADVKTTVEYGADADAFSRRVSDLDYHLQDAYYTDLLGLASFTFVVVEEGAHAGVSKYRLEADDRELGRRSYNAHLQRVKECMLTDTWPSYPSTIRKIDLTPWKRKKEMEDVE